MRSVVYFLGVCILAQVGRSAVRANDGVDGVLTAEDRNTILDQHNVHRSQVIPPATNMKKMKWNFDLAKMAQLWANTCQWKHGNPTCTNKPYTAIGQNLYQTSGTTVDLAKAIAAWNSEKQFYTLSTNKCQASKVCGHYTQVVWAKSEEVGCGIKKCTGIILVCNYGPAGNYVGQSPYKTGVSCSNCATGLTCDSGTLCVNSTDTYTIPNSAPATAMTCEGDNNGGTTTIRPATLLVLPLVSATLIWQL